MVQQPFSGLSGHSMHKGRFTRCRVQGELRRAWQHRREGEQPFVIKKETEGRHHEPTKYTHGDLANTTGDHDRPGTASSNSCV